jgi:hypothetical protein
MKTLATFFVVAVGAFFFQPLGAQDTSGPVSPAAPPPADVAPPAAQVTTTTTTTTTTEAISSSASQAVQVAALSVDASVRDHLVSIYGVGTPTAINRWWVIFYDPSVPSHGRAVRVENGQATKTYVAQGGVVYERDLTFHVSHVSGEGAALQNAENYAAQQGIVYDGVRALLRRNSTEGPLRWRVELMHGAENKGFVFTNSDNGSFAMYSAPGATPSGQKSATGGADGGLVGDAKHFGNDVKHTFLGIGGDLQEFFTGERTVDQ